MNNPKFTIHPSQDGQFYFTLTAENGQVLVTSETYTQKHNCIEGIAAVCTAVYAATYEKLKPYQKPNENTVSKEDIKIDDLTL